MTLCINAAGPTTGPTTGPTVDPTGSCISAGYNGCCDNDTCQGFSPNGVANCFCDQLCYNFDDCCGDIENAGCYPQNSML